MAMVSNVKVSNHLYSHAERVEKKMMVKMFLIYIGSSFKQS